MALLQHCAAIAGAPLIIYTNPRPSLRVPVMPAFSISHDFSAEPEPPRSNPIDLDLWLDVTAGTAAGKFFTHKEFLLAIGNTVAAHLDRDMHPFIVAAEMQRQSVASIEEMQSAHRAYVLALSGCILPLVDTVLRAAGRPLASG